MHESGCSISYERVLEICDAVGESVVSRYIANGVVCPLKMKGGVFTTSAVDNIDHNPSATTSNSSFHGTSISLFQHEHSSGIPQEKLVLSALKNKKIPMLPDSFINVLPAVINKECYPHDTSIPVSFDILDLDIEYKWLDKVCEMEIYDESAKITWSSHHALKCSTQEFEIGTTALLPLLRDQAHDVATIKHVMDKVKDAVKFLNPNQPPVLGADQQFFALPKHIQWSYPEAYGEYVMVLESLWT